MFGHLSKLGLPYVFSSLVLIEISLDKYSIAYPTYLYKSLDTFELKFVLKWIFSYFCYDVRSSKIKCKGHTQEVNEFQYVLVWQNCFPAWIPVRRFAQNLKALYRSHVTIIGGPISYRRGRCLGENSTNFLFWALPLSNNSIRVNYILRKNKFVFSHFLMSHSDTWYNIAPSYDVSFWH